MAQGLMLRLAGSHRFHTIAARIPILRRIARAEGGAIFDIVQGFARSQVLATLIDMSILQSLQAGPQTAAVLAQGAGISTQRMELLCKAGVGIGLMKPCKRGGFQLTIRGASLLAVPGLVGMIQHHGAFYADLADLPGLLRGGGQTQLSQVWPYVFGAGAATDPARAARYSALMADSQVMVAQEVLAHTSLAGSDSILDIGGGTGAFLAAVGARYRSANLHLFDLPAVLAGAQSRLSGLGGRVHLHAGSFRDDPLPKVADTITLIRVLYDHDDAVVTALLRAVYNALPVGGRLIIAEPMSGGDRPDPITDVYFALYTLAMQTGRTRSAGEIAAMLATVGFGDVQITPCFRSYIASVVSARRI